MIEATTFKVGDVVRLKSGSPRMTVSAVPGRREITGTQVAVMLAKHVTEVTIPGTVTVVWQSGGRIMEKTLPVECLVMAESTRELFEGPTQGASGEVGSPFFVTEAEGGVFLVCPPFRACHESSHRAQCVRLANMLNRTIQDFKDSVVPSVDQMPATSGDPRDNW